MAISVGSGSRLESNGKSVDETSGSNLSVTQEHIFNSSRDVQAVREYWLENLPLVEDNALKVIRFAECCSQGWVEQSNKTGEIRVRYNCCGYRFCPHCHKSFQAQTRDKLFQVLEQEGRLKFITLTQQSNSEPLKKQLDDLRKAFRRLRQQKFWRAENGYAVIEVTYNNVTDRWHPHLHIIAKSEYMDKESLSKAWLQASKGSFIVDIREIKDKLHAANYLTSYMSKMDSKDKDGNLKILGWPLERLREYYAALHYRRLVLKFGTWPSLSVTDDNEEADNSWKVIGSIEELFEALPSPYASEVLQKIGYLKPNTEGENTS